ncbi:MAG TPA: YaiO family outer membrane beta-barrel protein [Bacteroidia bacterium]|nr:YaiO family outer membrane beta-barrel protein [Bacteroidia bacterium]
MKYRNFISRYIILTSLCFCIAKQLSAQVGDVDSAFQQARTLAFSSRYTESISLCKKILEKSPNYQDVRVLLGRVYFWNNQKDSAISTLSNTIKIKPYEDAYIAYADILRWADLPLQSMQITEEGLSHFPNSEDLLLRKIKALDDLKEYKKAYHLADSLLSKKNTDADLRQLTETIKNKMAKNTINISYDYDYFDKQFPDPWHLVSFSYGRQTTYLGRVTARVNLANRFAANGSQLEMDAYPSLGKKMYAYLNAGYANNTLFPNYRFGVSVYRNFPHAFEGEVGIRVLYFSKATILYVGSIGKYAGDFWFSLRPTFIASENGNRFSQSYSFITRYYYKTAFDYLTLTVGYGLAPDDRSRETLLQNPDLKRARIQLAVQKLIKRTHIVSLSGGISRGEYIQGDRNIGNNIFAGVSYQKMF